MDEQSLFTSFWTSEAKTTRNVLARIPEGSDYRPDPKSWVRRAAAGQRTPYSGVPDAYWLTSGDQTALLAPSNVRWRCGSGLWVRYASTNTRIHSAALTARAEVWRCTPIARGHRQAGDARPAHGAPLVRARRVAGRHSLWQLLYAIRRDLGAEVLGVVVENAADIEFVSYDPGSPFVIAFVPVRIEGTRMMLARHEGERSERLEVASPYTTETLVPRGAAHREIERGTGVDRKTIRRYNRA